MTQLLKELTAYDLTKTTYGVKGPAKVLMTDLDCFPPSIWYVILSINFERTVRHELPSLKPCCMEVNRLLLLRY